MTLIDLCYLQLRLIVVELTHGNIGSRVSEANGKAVEPYGVSVSGLVC
jgi:hypothetical protein